MSAKSVAGEDGAASIESEREDRSYSHSRRFFFTQLVTTDSELYQLALTMLTVCIPKRPDKSSNGPEDCSRESRFSVLGRVRGQIEQ